MEDRSSEAQGQRVRGYRIPVNQPDPPPPPPPWLAGRSGRVYFIAGLFIQMVIAMVLMAPFLSAGLFDPHSMATVLKAGFWISETLLGGFGMQLYLFVRGHSSAELNSPIIPALVLIQVLLAAAYFARKCLAAGGIRLEERCLIAGIMGIHLLSAIIFFGLALIFTDLGNRL